MWKVCVVFLFLYFVFLRYEAASSVWKLFQVSKVGRIYPFKGLPPLPPIFSTPPRCQRHVVFMWFPSVSSSSCDCVWVCLGAFLFCFHDDDFPACDSYVCLSSTFMTIYQGKLHLHLHCYFHSHFPFPIAPELGLLYAFIGYMKIFSTFPYFLPLQPRFRQPQLSATEVMKYFFLFPR